MEKLRIIYLVMYLLAFVLFCFLVQPVYCKKIYDKSDIVIRQFGKEGIKINRAPNFFCTTETLLLGPFPTQKNFQKNIREFRSMFTDKAWREIQFYQMKKED